MASDVMISAAAAENSPGQSHRQVVPLHFIRQWRRHRGLTQAQLAEAISLHRGQLNKIECGRRPHTRRVLDAIAARLDCTPDELVRRHPSHTSELETFYMSLSADERSRALDLLKKAFAR